jgi:hypothetical protein
MYVQSRISRSAERRAQRRARHRAQRKLRELSINNLTVLRTLKPSVRKRLAKERAPGLWILPKNTTSNIKQGGPYAHPSLLGLPAELRQKILLLSYDVNVMAVHALQSTERGECDRKNVTKTLRERITQLCQVSPVLRTDMQYVGRAWQQKIEDFESSDVKINKVKALMPLPQGLTYSPHRQSGVVVKDREKSLHKNRSAKCWYCNERHARTGTGCPKATQNPQGWLEDTRAISGWRSRKQTKNSFTGSKTVFND